MPPGNAIACALKVPCSQNQEFEKQHDQAAESLEPNDQCPVRDENIPGKLDLSLLGDQSASFSSQSTSSSVSLDGQSGEKVDSFIGTSMT